MQKRMKWGHHNRRHPLTKQTKQTNPFKSILKEMKREKERERGSPGGKEAEEKKKKREPAHIKGAEEQDLVIPCFQHHARLLLHGARLEADKPAERGGQIIGSSEG